MFTNTNAKLLYSKLIELINGSGLELSTAYYLVSNIALQLQIAMDEAILAEAQNQDETVETGEITVDPPLTEE